MRWCDGDLSIFQDLFLGVYKRWGRCIKGGIERLNYLLFSLTHSSLNCAHSGILLRMASDRDRLGTPGRILAGDARGNSTRWGQTFFRLSGPHWGLRNGATRVGRVADRPPLAPPPSDSPPLGHTGQRGTPSGRPTNQPAHQSGATVGLGSLIPRHGGTCHENCPEEHH